ncbi:MAG: RHS repeat protein, partial [Candidatus Aureabacteria bacterium]|nr:RHS repeat protein [Candidatus Auribacterota bacterium]
MINRCLNALILMTGVFLQLPCQAAYDVDFGKAMGITHANPFATDEVEYAPHDLLEADKMTYTAEDFNIAGKGRGADLNLSFIRYYTNENSAKGVCGHGWSTCLDVTLQFVGMLVDAVILDEKGEMFTFSVNGTDTWEPKSEPNPHRFYKQQINPETFYYIFERKYGNKYYFDSTFLLLEKITDRNGNTIVYNRDPETNLITSIEDNSGRQIQFTYDSFRKTVLTVTGPDNRTFHYYYNSILDNLIQVTDPENNSTFFEYTHYNVHNITKIITPNGNYQAFNYGIEKLSEIFQGPHLISTISCFEAGEIKNVQMQNPVGFTATRNILKTYDTNPPTTTITSTDNTGTETDILDKYGYEWKYTDKKGRYTVMTRDIRGNVLSMRNAKGYTTTQTFSALNKPLVMTSPLSLVERFIYDAKGNLIQYTNGEGGIYTLSYDANGLPLTFTDPNNKTETYEYDSYGNMTKVTDSETGVKEFSYDLYGNCIREKDERGYETFFEYDRMNRLKKTTFPDLSTRVLTYDGNGNVLTTQDENGNETVFTYNEWDKKATVRDAEGNIRSFTYDAIGRLSAVTDGNNQVWTYEYDVLNNLTKKTFPDESFIRYEFDIQSSSKMVPSAGVKPKNVTDAMGAVTNFQYDEMYALFKETDALQKTTTFIHDSLDRIITYRDKLGKNYNMTYNKLNKVTSAQNPLGYVSSTVYDKMGQVLSKTDSNGKTVSYTYDGEGRVKTVTNALSQTVSYSYDAEGNVISITDAKNNSVNYEYDSRGRVSKERDALGNESRVFYDNAGNIVRKVRPDNTEVLYTYYRNNLLKTISYPAAGKTVSFEYDGNNNPVKMTDWLGETNYVYDSRNRLTEITEPTGRKIRYEYDANGRRTALKLLNDGVSEAYRLNYTYDVLNRLTRIADSSNAFVNFTYDALGRRILQEYSNGVKAAFVYNDISFLTRIRAVNSGNGVIMQLDYTHDKAGNILSETEQGGLTKTYSYDSIYQLLGVGYSDGTSCAFSYDAAGNRLSKTENGISTTYTYNNLNQLTQALENGVQTDFVYDLNGNLLQETNANQIMTYGYNFLNKVASINKVTATENITLSMVYNSEGKRISKAYSTGETWNYVYDGQNVLQEQNGGNTSFYLP